MTLPPADHPIWKLLQGLVSLAGLLILVTHGIDGGHTGGPDLEDAAGGLGVLTATRLGWLAWRAKSS